MAGVDALRVLAAMAVVTFHFTARDHLRWGVLPITAFPSLSRVTHYGYVGVHLFFVISGFVILMSAWGRSAREFVASRVSRLYPAYWAAVLLTASLRWISPTFDGRAPWEVAVNLTMMQDLFAVPRVDGVYWTLWVELQFYALMLLLLRGGFSRRRVMVSALALSTVGAASTLLWPASAGVITFLGFAPLFAAGMVLYLLHSQGGSLRSWLALACVTTEAAAVAAVHQRRAIDAITTGAPTSPVVMFVLVVGCVALVGGVTLVPRLRELDWRFLTILGALTYPLYLTHEYVGWALIDALHEHVGRTTTLGVTTGACVVLAWAMERLVERPARPRLRRAVLGRAGRSTVLLDRGTTSAMSRSR